jgi:N-acetyltransferase
VLSPFALHGRLISLEPLDSGHARTLAAAAAEDRAGYRFTWVPDGPGDARRYVDSALAHQAAGRALPFVVRRRAERLARSPGD